ncbi:hypothetical protein PILCRDRAFT_810160 [Piloderma croceum F 1598]|uniref:Carbohydrate-binding module family 19 domain-containing protein n=1 Tax=Piloderma croceum (strain F 1598) TaxID=765440 RepID=A0A0C3CR80_PILCF|nr:hypothetical protein PILCRDRAFT_810160 [Piloderma croceum F 1598]
MKFIAISTIFALVLATAAAGKAIGTDPKNPQQPSNQQTNTAQKNPQQPSTSQKCTTLSKCPCAKGQTQFCGDEGVNPACLNGHLFVCDESAGKACDNGVDASCRK